MKISLNGKDEEIPAGTTAAGLLELKGLHPAMAAMDVNGDLVRKDARAGVVLKDGDKVEVVRMIAGGAPEPGELVIAGKAFQSRLLLGTGRYPSFGHMQRCHARSGRVAMNSSRAASQELESQMAGRQLVQ